ncbi:MAG: type I 3-dehydroquinate dehydratase, partial [Lachnospiraceae bacterium]|nr:type I 3-dehydroquinate dehydratase [Lachnospiraceae bacterium]
MDPENITFRPVTVCNMTIGEGLPKICIPLTGDTPDKLMQELLSVLPEKPDMLEWRADFYKPLWNDLNKTGGAAIDEADTRFAIEFRYALKNAIETIFRVCAPQIPVLFTVRTDSEGGHLFI